MNIPLPEGAALRRQSRQFGFLLGAVLALVAFWKALLWLYAPAALLALLGAVAPGALVPLTRLWLQLGGLLARVMNPIILGILWLFLFTPFGLLRQWFAADPMRRSFEPEAKSYWIDQPVRRHSLEDFKRQF